MDKSLREWVQIIASEDAVSRKELLKIFEDRFLELQKLKQLKDNKGAEDRQMGVNYCINILKELPPITSPLKTGHWVKHETGHSVYYDCSLCGCAAPCTETADTILWKMANYCPDCGARMKEVEE